MAAFPSPKAAKWRPISRPGTRSALSGGRGWRVGKVEVFAVTAASFFGESRWRPAAFSPESSCIRLGLAGRANCALLLGG